MVFFQITFDPCNYNSTVFKQNYIYYPRNMGNVTI